MNKYSEKELETCTQYFEKLFQDPPPHDDPIWELLLYLENPRTRSHCRYWLENFDKHDSIKDVDRAFIRYRREQRRNAASDLRQMLEQAEMATHRFAKLENQVKLGALVKQAKLEEDPIRIETIKGRIQLLKNKEWNHARVTTNRAIKQHAMQRSNSR